MEVKKDILWRVYLVYFAVCLFGIAIVAKAAYIQVAEGEELRAKVESFSTTYRNIEPVRGNIYALDGSLLATSVPIYEVRMDPNTEALTDKIWKENIDTLAMQLAALWPGEKEAIDWARELQQARDNGSRYHLIGRNVKFTDLKQMRDFHLFRRGRYKGGFLFIQQNKRSRPFRILAARTIGYDREDMKPVGLEGAYSEYLRGREGKRLMQKIAGGVWMPLNDANEVEPEDGADIYTTIDVNIQDVAETALMEQLQLQKSDHGCVVVMEVATGEVKAIANLRRTQDGEYHESYNYAVGESTEPGSTFKLAALISLLEDGLVRITDSVDAGKGRMKFYDVTLTDSKRGGHGKMSVKDAVAFSSNIAFAKMTNDNYGRNPQQYIDRICKMNINKPLGLEIAGEGKPYFKTDRKEWSGITLPWTSIGYEVQQTPLQILTFYNAVANNGKMVKPMFVKEIRKRGKVVKTFEPTVLNPSIASKETISAAKECLAAVVEYGTARNLKEAHFNIAGKTGTARIANDKYGYQYESEYSYQASFAGFFPAEKPKYSCIVVVNAPSEGVYYANRVAGPIFKEIADKIYAMSIDIHDELAPQEHLAASRIPYSRNGHRGDLETVFNEIGVTTHVEDRDEMWAVTQTGVDSVAVQVRKVIPNLVPNVVGMSARDAIYLLENAGVMVKLNGAGIIKKQSVQPGVEIHPAMQIELELS